MQPVRATALRRPSSGPTDVSIATAWRARIATTCNEQRDANISSALQREAGPSTSRAQALQRTRSALFFAVISTRGQAVCPLLLFARWRRTPRPPAAYKTWLEVRARNQDSTSLAFIWHRAAISTDRAGGSWRLGEVLAALLDREVLAALLDREVLARLLDREVLALSLFTYSSYFFHFKVFDG
eukprot:6195503-Pleurochrysis_carterae.AAC.1